RAGRGRDGRAALAAGRGAPVDLVTARARARGPADRDRGVAAGGQLDLSRRGRCAFRRRDNQTRCQRNHRRDEREANLHGDRLPWLALMTAAESCAVSNASRVWILRERSPAPSVPASPPRIPLSRAYVRRMPSPAEVA